MAAVVTALIHSSVSNAIIGYSEMVSGAVRSVADTVSDS